MKLLPGAHPNDNSVPGEVATSPGTDQSQRYIAKWQGFLFQVVLFDEF